MSKFEVEFRIPTRQQYAYINIKILSDNQNELEALTESAVRATEGLAVAHAKMYDAANGRKPEIVVSTAPPMFNAEEAIKADLGGKVIEESAPTDATKKPWERAKPPAPAVPPTPKTTTKSLFG